MEGTEEDFIRLESGGTMSTIHPDDREEVAYLFRNHVTRAGSNSLTVRKKTVKGNWIWVSIHYAFVKEDGVQYAYCTYFDVIEVKENEIQLESMYEGMRSEILKLSKETLSTVRVNLTLDVTDTTAPNFSEGFYSGGCNHHQFLRRLRFGYGYHKEYCRDDERQYQKGVGSEFTVNVTLKNCDRTDLHSSDLRPREMNVLVIDDDPIACEHARLVLEEVGIVAETCLSGAEALKMIELRHARRDAYNLILVSPLTVGMM